jgi:hypothetical protein
MFRSGEPFIKDNHKITCVIIPLAWPPRS